MGGVFSLPFFPGYCGTQKSERSLPEKVDCALVRTEEEEEEGDNHELRKNCNGAPKRDRGRERREGKGVTFLVVVGAA